MRMISITELLNTTKVFGFTTVHLANGFSYSFGLKELYMKDHFHISLLVQ
ncbi:hypothetical protein Scep_019555 [Stephania cephalantha]|uniref:Uncharacterized protein n=1 Tax=Stephania cephalantha TaxID=152367 RepID=A0AAP0IBZ8_9MAGN